MKSLKIIYIAQKLIQKEIHFTLCKLDRRGGGAVGFSNSNTITAAEGGQEVTLAQSNFNHEYYYHMSLIKK